MKHEGPNPFGRMPRVPKFLVSLMLALGMVFTAAAQTRVISINLRNVTVKEFLSAIETRSNYTFAYNNADIDLTALVSVRAESEEIVSIVNRVLLSRVARPAAAAETRESQRGVITDA